MITGRFFLEISPDQLLVGEGPWTVAPEEAEWKIAIMPFKPLPGVSPSFLTASRWQIVNRAQLSAQGNASPLPTLKWTPSPRANFTRAFEGLQSLIKDHNIRKGVPFGWEQATFPNSQSLWKNLLFQVKNLPPHLHAYGAELANESVVGATPEWLFHMDSHTLNTMAVAATRWKGQQRGSGIEDKEATEHQWVVDDIVSRLRSFGDVSLGERRWVSAGELEHLKTPITLHAHRPLIAEDMLALLHPTPAVGVFPRTPVAQKWLDTLPGHEIRADFAAPWVVKHRDGRAFGLVALRQIRLRPDHVWIPAGCGVVATSQEEAEWKEIQQKIQSVKKNWALV
jgi:isochorismate synthase EntC